ncbi:hypothetical protein OO006_11325 [Prosthecochloris sp. SCSIO W1101]|uniref:hypothetical protein n=1 Tax=Prosthecochloris sp. SCSIO W1101 TaxID=2992242 RepID=UPI00223D3B14|nr:hypothetical protein [Prosthecochloris sp. SCSIO W1101]UZJ40932.1 hypothetical protein OO006_11325 [Prosthecochloris sp. SCSIO W1101]
MLKIETVGIRVRIVVVACSAKENIIAIVSVSEIIFCVREDFVVSISCIDLFRMVQTS